MIKEAIARLVEHEPISQAEAYEVMQRIMSGEATDAQIAAYLIALRMCGETPETINFRDFAKLFDYWGLEQLWPPEPVP